MLLSNIMNINGYIQDKLMHNETACIIKLTANVVRAGIAKVLEYEKTFICSDCGLNFKVPVELEKNFVVKKPTICPSVEGCTSRKFTLITSSESNCPSNRDYQEIMIQEQVQKLPLGTVSIYDNQI